MGDVVMVLPVLRALRSAYPNVEIVFVSQGFAGEFVEELGGVRFIAAKIRGVHKGVRGLWRLSGEIAAEGTYSAIADLHGVLRVRLLKLFLWLRSYGCMPPVATIDKGRREKHRLTRARRKRMVPLRHSVQRYADCFARLGYAVEIPCRVGGLQLAPGYGQIVGSVLGKRPLVGVAPFAAHRGKAYPPERMRRVVQQLASDGCMVYLFGGPGAEAEELGRWASESESIVSVPQMQIGLYGEAQLMGRLDAMIAMDSGNMHIASWAGVTVISVWGATHPYAGFLGWGQPLSSVIARDDLPCRPCSVFGNRPCMRGDYACLDIDEGQIAQCVRQLLSDEKRRKRVSCDGSEQVRDADRV